MSNTAFEYSFTEQEVRLEIRHKPLRLVAVTISTLKFTTDQSYWRKAQGNNHPLNGFISYATGSRKMQRLKDHALELVMLYPKTSFEDR